MHVFRLNLVSILVFLATLAAPFASPAAAPRPYDEHAFKAAQDAGKTVLIEVHADWCSTCRTQLPILDKISGERAYTGIERFRIDFDTQKDLVKKFKAPMQSTLVLYKGKTEVARSVGETDESRIRAMLDKAR